MRVLDLFAGLKGWSQAFAERGHDVTTVELEARFEPTIAADILTLGPADLPGPFDVILASPPCTGFTVQQIGRNWHHDGRPKTAKAELALTLIAHTLELIEALAPTYWVLENPVGKLRSLPVVRWPAGSRRWVHPGESDPKRPSVTYCGLGESRRKPTDLWGGFPPSLELPPPCYNGMPCHTAAPRGSTTGTQGLDPATSAKVPHALSLAVCIAAELDLGADRPAVIAPVQPTQGVLL